MMEMTDIFLSCSGKVPILSTNQEGNEVRWTQLLNQDKGSKNSIGILGQMKDIKRVLNKG